ncbi:4,5-DOPA dioxygenase extradiol [Serratia ureilytica]
MSHCQAPGRRSWRFPRTGILKAPRSPRWKNPNHSRLRRGSSQALFDTRHPAPGSPRWSSAQLQQMLAPVPVTADLGEWGVGSRNPGRLDRDVPPMLTSRWCSSASTAPQPAAYHSRAGGATAVLRDEGVMIVASGNVVHNLRMVKWQGDTSAYPWAESFNNFVRDNLRYRGENHPLVDFMRHEGAALSNPTPEHYLPLLYVLGGWDGKEAISVPIDGIEMGALSMLSVQVG